MAKIYLASKSPRRRELLRQIEVPFDLLMFRAGTREDADVDESTRPREAPRAYVERIARTKALGGWSRLALRHLPRAPVLSADTTVALGETIYGKPDNARHAADILKALSGNTHDVRTAVALQWEDDTFFAISESRVTFRTLTTREISDYITTGEPMDKAGAYAVQGRAAVFIERIEGSYSGIMGLPLFETAALLAQLRNAHPALV